MFLFYLIFIVFFHCHLVPLDPLPLAIDTLLSMPMIPFAPSLHPLTSPATSCHKLFHVLISVNLLFPLLYLELS